MGKYLILILNSLMLFWNREYFIIARVTLLSLPKIVLVNININVKEKVYYILCIYINFPLHVESHVNTTDKI